MKSTPVDTVGIKNADLKDKFLFQSFVPLKIELPTMQVTFQPNYLNEILTVSKLTSSQTHMEIRTM